MIELLAPAKDKICAKAAIDYGADAIYIGASEFGARKKVPNSIEDIKEVVEYAHKFNVKVYVTINTILTDDEIIKAKELIEKLSQIRVDAIIIQDMGLVEYLSGVVGTPPYHASTQCDNRTVDKIKFLENVGFSRVILARELSIEQIREIKKNTNVELETFIHGALCVSYSGQCYLSQAIGGRSANRGECAQPCRKKYSIVSENTDGTKKFIAKDKYLLNLKDLNASKHIKELVDAGVTSFKIEGRLKDVNYVKNVVAYYRKLIDELGYNKTSSGEIALDFEPNAEKSFNRGFTDYFLQKRGECYSFDSPKSMGEYIGKVTKVEKDFFEISLSGKYARPTTQINAQDGLCFFTNKELAGCLVNKVEDDVSRSGFCFAPAPLEGEGLGRGELKFARQQKIYPNKIDGIKVGIEIYRNFDAKFEKKLTTSKTCRKIGVNIEFYLNKIKAVDENGQFVEIEYSFEELAQNTEKMGINIINQLKKSGDTDFLVKDVIIKTEKLPFLPVSKLNELRRELLEKLLKERGNREQETEGINVSSRLGLPTQQKFPHSEIDYRGNVLNKYAKEFYEKHGCKVIETALESGGKSKGKTVMTTKHCLKYAFNMCKSNQQLYLIDEKDKHYELKFNCDKCEMEIVLGLPKNPLTSHKI